MGTEGMGRAGSTRLLLVPFRDGVRVEGYPPGHAGFGGVPVTCISLMRSFVSNYNELVFKSIQSSVQSKTKRDQNESALRQLAQVAAAAAAAVVASPVATPRAPTPEA